MEMAKQIELTCYKDSKKSHTISFYDLIKQLTGKVKEQPLASILPDDSDASSDLSSGTPRFSYKVTSTKKRFEIDASLLSG